jgi:prepilin-type N-terminal cleavage/methylation domain-containing protein
MITEKPVSHLRKSGFTLLEVLIVITVLGVITTVIAVLFAKGSFALRHTDAHNSLQRANRLLTARVTPYVASAFNTEQRSSPAILSPTSTATPNPFHELASVGPAPAGDSPMPLVRFLTTEDFLANTPGNTYLVDKPTSATLADSTAELGTFIYQIRLTTPDPANPDLGNVVLEKLGPGLTPVGSRTLFFSRSGAKIDPRVADSFQFLYPSNHILILEATMSTDIRSQTGAMTPSQTFRTTFNLPTKGS